MEKLKPCPFCGSGKVKIFAFSDGGICVKCLNCYCQTQAMVDVSVSECERLNAFEMVVKAWNRRVSDERSD